MQLSDAFLKFEDAPLYPRKVLLSVRLENSHTLEQISDFDLLAELVETSLEHSIACAWLSAAETATEGGDAELDVKFQ